jgi:hypothetical protein
MQCIDLRAGSLAYTFCQTPIIYRASDETGIEVYLSDGRAVEISGNQLDFETSQHIFKRDGVIENVVAKFKISHATN